MPARSRRASARPDPHAGAASRSAALPHPRPLIAVVGVGTVLAALIATGHPAAAGTGSPAVTAAAAAAAGSTADVATWWPRAPRAGVEHAPAPSVRTSSAASRSAHRAPVHRWVRPNYGPITSPFGRRWGRFHEGVDLGGVYGSAIRAATDGCIEYAGPMEGYGEVMKIRDWDGTETVYGHMSRFVRTHGCVHAGEVVARVGEAGDATGPHLHFEVRIHGVPVNPVPFLRRMGVRI
jgi:murein DD-endopeptidase MepM/ murein hydrolase activator NlpD